MRLMMRPKLCRGARSSPWKIVLGLALATTQVSWSMKRRKSLYVVKGGHVARATSCCNTLSERIIKSRNWILHYLLVCIGTRNFCLITYQVWFKSSDETLAWRKESFISSSAYNFICSDFMIFFKC